MRRQNQLFQLRKCLVFLLLCTLVKSAHPLPNILIKIKLGAQALKSLETGSLKSNRKGNTLGMSFSRLTNRNSWLRYLPLLIISGSVWWYLHRDQYMKRYRNRCLSSYPASPAFLTIQSRWKNNVMILRKCLTYLVLISNRRLWSPLSLIENLDNNKRKARNE